MATIKGENLRLFLNGECVAAATSCQLHVALQLGESDTKDDVDDFIVQEPIGHAWDAQADAMLLEGDSSRYIVVKEGSGQADTPISGGYYYNEKIQVRAGEKIAVYFSGGNVTDITIYSEGFQTLASQSSVRWLEYEVRNDGYVYVGVAASGYTLNYRVTSAANGLSSAVTMLVEGAQVEVEFNTTVEGTLQNRQVETQILQGTAIVQDISVNAPNQDIVTYSVKLQGVGMLSIS